jgi:NADPH:quinone reductase-like Zn-dependent oxidoreductase
VLAAYASAISADDPLSGLTVGERPPPRTPDGWTTVTMRAAALNHHDLWSLRGVGLRPDRLPMVLGTDGAGIDEKGREVVVHAVIASPGWTDDETLDPRRTLLSEKFDGTLAERVAVPRRNVVPKPPELSFEEQHVSRRRGSRPTACSSRWRDPTREAPSWSRGRTVECPAR